MYASFTQLSLDICDNFTSVKERQTLQTPSMTMIAKIKIN